MSSIATVPPANTPAVIGVPVHGWRRQSRQPTRRQKPVRFGQLERPGPAGDGQRAGIGFIDGPCLVGLNDPIDGMALMVMLKVCMAAAPGNP